jgi:hypothetical protein
MFVCISGIIPDILQRLRVQYIMLEDLSSKILTEDYLLFLSITV